MRVVGECIARCDATLTRGSVAVVDPEIAGWGGVVYLSKDGLMRFREVELLPREWLRLACRISPNYRLLEGACYSRFGEPEYTDRTINDLESINRAEQFPTTAEIARSPRTAVRVGVAWAGHDLLAEASLGSFRQLINAHSSEALYDGLDSLIARRRQVEEIRDLCYVLVERMVDAPERDWIDQQWMVHGAKSFGALIDLSLRVWRWQAVEEKAIIALWSIPEDRRKWKTASWHRLIQAAPTRERDRLVAAFVRAVPVADRDRVIGLLM